MLGMEQHTFSIRKQSAEWKRDDKTLRGLITLPFASAPVAAVVMCHGFTGHMLEGRGFFRRLSEQLAQAGVAAIRFDFAGSGESDGTFEEMTLSSELADALAVFRSVRSMDGIDPNRVSLLGFSMGGAVSLLAGAQLGDELHRLVGLCPAANIFDIVAREASGPRFKQLMEEGRMEMNGFIVGQGLLEDTVQHDMYAAASRIQCPTLFVHGTADGAVPPYISHRLAAAMEGRAGITWIDGSDHVFSLSEHAKQVCKAVVHFLAD
ncbi:alpha/beta hydrolase family protein [Paenibacillus sp.]|uniref:alpha/beta hydrolase family protein n=1 Tax=Paenibacillus sp. TaxID=58172 RepID=UPI0034645CA3